jgi:hypothetical protein
MTQIHLARSTSRTDEMSVEENGISQPPSPEFDGENVDYYLSDIFIF